MERYLEHRRRRWPTTANPHLLITQQTAHDTGPASTYWFKSLSAGQGITLTRLRQDRLLEELAAADPLCLVAMFGLHPNAAARYAATVRTRIEDAAAAVGRAAGHTEP